MTHAEARIIALQVRSAACQTRVASMLAANQSAKLRRFTFVPYNTEHFMEQSVELEQIAAAINDYAQQLN